MHINNIILNFNKSLLLAETGLSKTVVCDCSPGTSQLLPILLEGLLTQLKNKHSSQPAREVTML